MYLGFSTLKSVEEAKLLALRSSEDDMVSNKDCAELDARGPLDVCLMGLHVRYRELVTQALIDAGHMIAEFIGRKSFRLVFRSMSGISNRRVDSDRTKWYVWRQYF